ncbi:thiamine-phosphate pyrophosphorylase [Aquimarina sp. EL_43]|uniref:thiamine phosphate synthase n=1 Tax=Aquimarina TaxID=290174 RepID=UPI00046FB469|nr:MULTISPECIES: thiamine phosphate synthase [Aquimarina]MBG6131952.1 thiamine-phosphate pyrophosphorylase [Aquimarina sp. EL_35]MBG6149516.1 thiamine-phosphate pyrophosphorylase [Aquimarina sp. EL_32]MBG6170221.1 thiamine-phosphate pyrophosphorylase [Aquimarina sp. EL_43]
MLIILTSEQELESEADKINSLFDNGLEILHFRKPTMNIEGYRVLLNQIDTKYHNRIMIHQFHELCEEFNLRGIHIQEQPRLDLEEKLEEYIYDYKTKDYKVSSSFHSKEDIKNCPATFEYVLLSPVFSSISKVGYTGKGFDVTDLNEFVIGMGGINESTLQATFDLGFKGVGVLGGIWNTEDSLESFKMIYDKLKTIQTT